jgi:hypothetical protein
VEAAKVIIQGDQIRKMIILGTSEAILNLLGQDNQPLTPAEPKVIKVINCRDSANGGGPK